jgi:hypothetical protein
MATKKPKSKQKLSSGWRLFKQALGRLQENWPLYGRVTLIYGLLDLLLVRGLSEKVNLSGIKGGFVSSGANRISALFGAPTSSIAGDASALYQSILLVLASLAFIWALRQLKTGQKKTKGKTATLSAKQAYYQSTNQLIPFILLLLWLSLQLLPMLISGGIYSTVINRGVANGAIETIAWALGFFALSVWSLYMVSVSILGLFVVTLPKMYPMAAWQAARQLAAGRRWLVLRKLLFLPAILVVAVTVICLPFAILVPIVAEWVFFVLGVLALPVSLSYIYELYLEML